MAFSVVLLLAITAVGVPALPAGLFNLPPETDDVRVRYLDDVLAPVFRYVEFRSRTEPSLASGRDVLVTTDSSDDYRYFLFVPELADDFPLYSAGTYILRRRKADGGVDQLKIFLRSDPDFFVRIRPEPETSGAGHEPASGARPSGRSLMSVFIAGVEVHRSVPLPISIETLLSEPFERIVDLTALRVDWSVIYPEVNDPGYRTVALVAGRAREMLHTLPDADDGAMDEHGNLVLIESLVLQEDANAAEPGFNCSGFAKWIVDGLYFGRYGRFLPIEPLRTKHLDLRGNRWSAAQEDVRDPYFGLDWTRNLATALLSASQGGEMHPEAADVRSVPHATYVEDVGYQVERLPLVLYQLAQREPGYLYLASINRPFGTNPTLHQHVHVVVLFPYFDETGRFVVNVMERNVETSIASLDRRYGNDSVHLVRVRADASYAPPVIRN